MTDIEVLDSGFVPYDMYWDEHDWFLLEQGGTVLAMSFIYSADSIKYEWYNYA